MGLKFAQTQMKWMGREALASGKWFTEISEFGYISRNKNDQISL